MRRSGWHWALLALGLPVLLLLLAVSAPLAWSALSARFGEAEAGTFVVRSVQCARMCDALGEFRPADGGAPVPASWGGAARDAVVGDEYPARLPAGSEAAFPAEDPWAWLPFTAVVAGVLYALWLWARALRRMLARDDRPVDVTGAPVEGPQGV